MGRFEQLAFNIGGHEELKGRREKRASPPPATKEQARAGFEKLHKTVPDSKAKYSPQDLVEQTSPERRRSELLNAKSRFAGKEPKHRG